MIHTYTFLVILSYLDDNKDKAKLKLHVEAETKEEARSVGIQVLFERDPENTFISAKVSEAHIPQHIDAKQFKAEKLKKWRAEGWLEDRVGQ